MAFVAAGRTHSTAVSSRARPYTTTAGWTVLQLVSLLVGLSHWQCGAGLDNGLANTPPMGFNTWNGLQDNYNESVIVEVINRMSEQLLPFGYEYVVLTEQSMPTTGPHSTGPRRAADTVFRVDEPRFPNGMQFLAEHAHKKGMKFGLYTSGSRITCEQRWGSLYHEVADAELFAQWGVDWVWYDECSESHLSQRAKIGAMMQAINKTGRPMVFQCCPFARLPTTGYNSLCNNRRTTEDIDASWRTILRNLDGNDAWADYAEIGSWNDADMLEVGNGNLSVEEWRSHFTLWSLMKTPLQLGLDPRNIRDEVLEIITNKEIIGWNQDRLGIQGRKLASFNSSLGQLTTNLVLARCISRQPVAGAPARSQDHALHTRQIFHFVEADGTIRTADGRCITAVGGMSAAAKAPVPAAVAPCIDADSQRWVFVNGTGTLGRLALESNTAICLQSQPHPNGVFYPYPPEPPGLGLNPPDRNKNDSIIVGLCEPEPPCVVGKSSFVERACMNVQPTQHWLLLGNNLLPSSGRYDHYEYFNPPTAPYGLDSWSDDHGLCLSLGLEGDLQVWGGPLRDDRVALALFNRGNQSAMITAFASALSLPQADEHLAYDAWQNESLGVFAGNVTLEVDVHAVRAITLKSLHH